MTFDHMLQRCRLLARRAFPLSFLLVLVACSPELKFDSTEHDEKLFAYFNHKAKQPSDGPRLPVVNGQISWDVASRARDAAGAIPLNAGDETLFVMGISGGGNKSSVFASAVMLELQAFGLLQEVDAISSASGGSFPALFYALSCDAEENKLCEPDPDGWRRPAWNRKNVYETFNRNWLASFLAESLSLGATLRNVSTYHDTHDSFVKILERDFLPPKKPGASLRFADLNPKRPALFLNATNISWNRRNLLKEKPSTPKTNSRFDETTSPLDKTKSRFDKTKSRFDEAQISNIAFHFSFTEPYFKRIDSDLAQYPVVRALVASAAFPLIIDSATLLNWRTATSDKPEYLHLTDAGVHDNVGLMELQWAVECFYADILDRAHSLATQMAGCDRSKQPKHVIAAVIDASITASTGVDPTVPEERSLADSFPIKVGVTLSSVDFMSYGNTIQRKAAMARLIEDINQRTKNPDRAAVYLPIDLQGLAELACDRIDLSLLTKPNQEMASDECIRTAKTYSFAMRHGLHHDMTSTTADLLAKAIKIPTNFQTSEDDRAILRESARWLTLRHLADLCVEDPKAQPVEESEKQDAPPARSAIRIIFGSEKFEQICEPEKRPATRVSSK